MTIRPMAFARTYASLLLWSAATTGADFALVRDGRPQATIVLAAKPTPAAEFAAAELRHHVQRITGALLPMAMEGQEVRGPRILIGESTAARALGLRPSDLEPREYLIRFLPDALVLLGRDQPSDPGAARAGPRAPEWTKGKFGAALRFNGSDTVLRAFDFPFPDAVGWAAYTTGGRGGKIVRVTNLNADGPGSFAAAVQTKGPRIIVFEVGGVIDLREKSIVVAEPFLTIAGQTAPNPGITFIRGGIAVCTHDVVVRHIRVRPGEADAAKKSGWEADCIEITSHDVIVDHCSCTWSIDENLSASGGRFGGDTAEQWRKNNPHRITFSNCIIAEGLRFSTHSKESHSNGSLIHDNVTQIAVVGNLYANNDRRNPFLKGGVRGIVVNNYIFNPGNKAIHYVLVDYEWKNREYVTGQIGIVGNVMEHGRDTREGLPLFSFRGAGPVDVFAKDNLATDRSGKKVGVIGTRDKKVRIVDTPPLWPEAIEVIRAADVKEYVLKNAGARPWDRDTIDKRIIRESREGTGKIIDAEKEVGGYPTMKETRSRFNPEEWDMATMERKRD